ncbi:MAG TPA: response regulator [Noviherbaspirillum sp.]|nr:response regulator [Noviherbaspirillum sp.]
MAQWYTPVAHFVGIQSLINAREAALAHAQQTRLTFNASCCAVSLLDKKTILLVEDASNDIELALPALHKCGVTNEIVVVNDRREGLGYLLCRKQYQHRSPVNPGLVLLNLKLQTVDGMEVLYAIRTTSELAPIPVIILTGSALEADISRTVSPGIEEYGAKPMDIQQLVNIMCGLASRFIRH